MSLQIQKDSRQMPKDKIFCSNKKYNDRLYGYLQAQSKMDVNTRQRYFLKKDINLTAIGKVVDLTRQTVKTKINELISLNLLTEEEDRYIINILDQDLAALIERDLLEYMIDSLSRYSISIYIFFLRKYYQNENPVPFYYDELKQYIGICHTTRSNDHVIINILKTMKTLGIIDYEIRQVNETGTEDGYRNQCLLTHMINRKADLKLVEC